MELTPEQLVDEERSDRPARAGRSASTTRRRASRPGATASRRRTTTSAAARSTTPPNKQAGRTTRRSRGRSARSPRSMPPSGPSTSSATVERAASPRDRPAELGHGPRTTRRRCSTSASGSPTTGSRRRARTAPARDLLLGCRRASGSGSDEALCRAGRDGPRRGTPARARARPHDPRDPGPARLGQDLHRGADDLLAARRREAGRHHGDQPQGHRQPADRGLQGRRAWRASRSGPSRRATRTRCSSTSASSAARTPRMSEPGSTTVGRTWPPGRLAVGVGEDDGRRRRPVRGRGGPDLARQRRSRSRGRPTASCCSAIRSSSISRSRAAIPQGADRSALAHILGRDADDATDAGPLPRNHVAAASRPVRLHLGGVLRRPSRAGAGARSSSGSMPPRRWSTAPGRGSLETPRSARTTSPRSRRTLSRGSPTPSSTEAAAG